MPERYLRTVDQRDRNYLPTNESDETFVYCRRHTNLQRQGDLGERRQPNHITAHDHRRAVMSAVMTTKAHRSPLSASLEVYRIKTYNGFSPTPSVAKYLSSAASRRGAVNAPIGIERSR